jgi:hypothetical protein
MVLALSLFHGVQATVQAALGPVAFQLADAALRYSQYSFLPLLFYS